MLNKNKESFIRVFFEVQHLGLTRMVACVLALWEFYISGLYNWDPFSYTKRKIWVGKSKRGEKLILPK